MVRSLWQRTAILLIAILIAVGFFFGWTTYQYTLQQRETIEKENNNSTTLWVNQTTFRLNALYEHIYELLLTLYNDTELRPGTPAMSAWTQQKTVEIMEDKLLVSDDADAFFVYDSQRSIFLFSADADLPAADILNLKDYIKTGPPVTAEGLTNRNWRIVSAAGHWYFFKSVQLGKYIVGAVSNLDYYYIDNNFSVLGENVSFRLLINDTYYPCGGTAGMEAESKERTAVTVAAPIHILEGTAILSVQAETLWSGVDGIQSFLLVDSALCLILVVILLFMLRRRVVLPTRALLKANHALASGNTDYRLQPETAGSAEFQSLYDSFNEMSEQIVQLRIQAYDMKLQEEQHKLTMLRAQIRPHSFLNAITTMSNMTYGSKPEEIRGYISAFAKFIRYMLNVSAPFTTVGDEIRQIRNYLAMQQSRFPDSVHLTVDCPEELADSKVPFLLLYTLVENSIKHAMTLYETLHVSLCCRRVETENFRGICLIQEDDGAGFPAHVLEELRQENTGELNTKEHLGLSNVRYTLHLVYRRGDLLRASNRETGGAHVEIWIPDEEKI